MKAPHQAVKVSIPRYLPKIGELLGMINGEFSDTLSDDVLSHFGIQIL